MEHLSNDHEDRLNQHENSHKLSDEMGYPVLSLLASQWKLNSLASPYDGRYSPQRQTH